MRAGRSRIRNWDDAVAYVRDTSAAAFPDYQDKDWRGFAERTFRAGPTGPEFDYDPAIAVVLQGGVPKLAPLIAWLLFRRLAKRRPTLLLRGELSDIMTAGIAQRMRKAVPSLHEVVVPGVGHAPVLTEPAAVDAIAHFLRTVP